MIGQHKRDLNVVPYRAGWVEAFEWEAESLRGALGEKALRIEHTGSTAVPGLAAKPIIDITVAVPSLEGAAALVPLLEKLGYRYRPLDTVPERLFFAKESAPEFRTHHLNMTEFESGFWKTQIAFRDALRADAGLAEDYVNLKRRIAAEYARTGVLSLEAKTPFVKRVLGLVEERKGAPLTEGESA